MDSITGFTSGAVFNGIYAGVDAYNAYNDFRSGNYGGGAWDTFEAGAHAADAYGSAMAGDWI